MNDRLRPVDDPFQRYSVSGDRLLPDENGACVLYDNAIHELRSCLRVVVELTREKYRAEAEVDKLKAKLDEMEAGGSK